MPFDPDAYLAEKEAFDPDAYLAEKEMPTEEPMLPEGTIPDGNAAKALLQGIGQGATLGFGEELGAAAMTPVAALYEKFGDTTDADLLKQGFTGDLEQKKGLLDIYRQLRDTSRQELAKTSEANPGAYFAGQVAGGAAIPGMGTMNVAKGAGLGALAGLGSSGQDVTRGDIPLLEPILGAAGGAVAPKLPGLVKKGFSGTKKGISKVLDKVGELIKKTEIGEDIAEGYTRGSAGQNLVGKEALLEAEKGVTGKSQELLSKLEAARKGVGSEISSAIEAAPPVEDLLTTLKAAKESIKGLPRYSSPETSDAIALNETLDKAIKAASKNVEVPAETAVNALTPYGISSEVAKKTAQVPKQVSVKEAKNIAEAVKDLTAIGEHGLKTPKAQMLAGDISKSVKGAYEAALPEEQLGQLKELQGRYAAAKTAGNIAGLPDKILSESDSLDAVQKISNLITKMDTETESGRRIREKITPFLANLEKLSPGLKDDFVAAATDKGRQLELSRKIYSDNAMKQNIGSLFGTIKGKAIAISNLTGQAANKLRPTMAAGKKMTLDYTNEQLQELAKKTPKFATPLLRAAGASPRTRRATLFSLMQNPEFRQASGLSEEDESNKSQEDVLE